jgi:hypothetical protein
MLPKLISNNLTLKDALFDAARFVILFCGAFGVFTALNITSPYPANDEYAYYSSVVESIKCNSIKLGYVQAACYVPIFLGVLVCKLVGTSYFNLRLISAAVSIATCAVFYLIMKNLHVSKSMALLLSIAVFFHPVSLNLSCHFMTDVITSFFVLICLGFIFLGLKKDKFWPTWFSQVALALAIFCRQHFFVISLVYPYLLARKRGRILISDMISLLPGCFAFLVANQMMAANAHATSVSFMSRLFSIIGLAFSKPIAFVRVESSFVSIGIIYLGIFCLAQIIIACVATRDRLRLKSPFGFLVLFAVAVILFGFYSLYEQQRNYPYLLNIIDLPRIGVINIIGTVPPVWRDPLILNAVSVFGLLAGLFGVRFVLCSIHRFPDRSTERFFMEAVIIVVSLLFGVTVLMTQVQALDRYYYCILLPMSILLGAACSKINLNRIKSFAVLLVVGLVTGYGFLSNLDYWRFINARSSLISSALSLGYSPCEIDAGPEYDFANAPSLLMKIEHSIDGNAEFPLSARGSCPETARQRWWAIKSENCIISTHPVVGFHSLKCVSYRSFLSNGRVALYLLGRDKVPEACGNG